MCIIVPLIALQIYSINDMHWKFVFELGDILKALWDSQVWSLMDFQIHMAVMMQYYRCYKRGSFV